MHNNTDTIVAQATAPGKGGVGIVRISGKDSLSIAEKIFLKHSDFFSPRQVKLVSVHESNGDTLDQGIVIYFQGPNSFTGEDVIEFHGHGGVVLLDLIIKLIISHGARMARPGEFSERAFLNDKIDLAQAEAIADLIESSTEQAARNSMRSLQGVFSKKILNLVEMLTQLRIYIEASIDFPDEEGVEFLSDGKIENQLKEIIESLDKLKQEAKQGSLLKEGMTVVIAGEPNAGKSSLLNTLSRKDSAIVTDIAGTTRDVLKESIQIDGLPLHIIDTAGLRESMDLVEQEGIKRAWKEIENADQILYVIDSNEIDQFEEQQAWRNLQAKIQNTKLITLIENKIDLSKKEEGIKHSNSGMTTISISAKHDQGIDKLRKHLKSSIGYDGIGEGGFSARRRHLEAIEVAEDYLNQGKYQLLENKAGDLLAEDLRLCQQALGEITGEVSSDDLLGRIFSSFCIGK